MTIPDNYIPLLYFLLSMVHIVFTFTVNDSHIVLKKGRIMNREFHPFLLSFELRKDSYFTVHKYTFQVMLWQHTLFNSTFYILYLFKFRNNYQSCRLNSRTNSGFDELLVFVTH